VIAAPEVADARVGRAGEALDHIQAELASAQDDADNASREYDNACAAVGQLNTDIAARSAQWNELLWVYVLAGFTSPSLD
jgi:hypothetical protein